jgi:RNA polymerase sigma-70 factor (ECF subfamily)
MQSRGILTERCRRYLLLIANQDLDTELRVKIGASDLVQETLLTAQSAFGRFIGSSDEELQRWLRKILLNKLATAQRTYRRSDKRNVSREQPLLGHLEGMAEGRSLQDASKTPSESAIAAEQAQALEEALASLSHHYREVIERRCFDLESFQAIGRARGISGDAARKLWCRAIERLRQVWKPDDASG